MKKYGLDRMFFGPHYRFKTSEEAKKKVVSERIRIAAMGGLEVYGDKCAQRTIVNKAKAAAKAAQKK
jgi:hypothetical protein